MISLPVFPPAVLLATGALVTILGSIAVMISIHFVTEGAGTWGLTPTTWGIGSAVVIMTVSMVLVSREGEG